MTLKRLLRHWFTAEGAVRATFPPAVLAAIERTIGEVEADHAGQIRFAVEASLDTQAVFAGQSARDRALDVFSALRVWDTEHNNGVLIYLLLADRDVEIVADRGIHRRVGGEGWEQICRAMEAEFRAGRFEAGSLAGIRAVGSHMARHYPRDGASVNELPDAPVVI
ncbi:MAG: TPM domain-containing protein [Burkholderiales bacterium]